ncbi:unnamed protein product [Angiostrongylus costaricensis]|uniref:Guanylate cyclase domain-containing protein n=1 Tax=Angiostrongylus costaricensis TaxID=334426 RepID=A0A0R3PQ69_ANGCS|nr:unnamed protein product [Angiostrongylus costaricensis]
MNTKLFRSKNLMDHVFTKLESYALTLETEVADRTKELLEEKKKSDILLSRMLPRQITEKLKIGHSIEPEMYESATVFFSDVVSFTTIAARGTPMNVINLLNDLYTLFDSIIDRHDVYKVETIGDAYLCVSGVPNRNGNEHVKEICSMSLGFMESLIDFYIPHLPGEKLSLRVGIHTAGMVHLSADANRLLQEVGGYQTELRGDVIIKGKGVLQTYWLKCRSEDGLGPSSSINKDHVATTKDKRRSNPGKLYL